MSESCDVIRVGKSYLHLYNLKKIYANLANVLLIFLYILFFLKRQTERLKTAIDANSTLTL